MAVMTYRQMAEKISTTYYRGVSAQESNFSLRHIAQLISEELAFYARKNAFENSNAGDTTYANDTFISTFKNLTLLYDSILKIKYVPLPSIPTALPSNQEIQKVWPVGARKVQIIPITNRSKFSQDNLPPIRNVVMYYIENGNLVIDNPNYFDITAININMVGAMPDGYLLDQTLLMPNNYESELSSKVIQRLLQTGSRPRDVINDGESNPS